MKKKFLTLLFSLALLNTICAQVNSFSSGPQRIETNFVSPTVNEEIKDAQGSPYLNEEFILAKINGSNEIFGVRYDAYQDLMEVQKDEDSKILLLDKEKNYIIKTTDNSKIYQTVSYQNGERGFAVSLWADGKHSLYAKEVVKFTPKKPAASGYESDKPAKFSRSSNIYYMKDTENGKLIELPNNKKKFFAVFKERSKEVQTYVKKEKLKISKKEDLIKIMRFYFASA